MEQSLLLFVLMSQVSFSVCHNYAYHFINESKTWCKAQKYCREHYTDLATVYNMADLRRLCAPGKNCTNAWIGLHHKSNNNKNWHWSLPGVEYNTSAPNWKQEEQNGGHDCHCVYIDKDMTWQTLPCSETKYHICYNETNSSFTLIKTFRTWFEAQKYCREKHTDLISGLHQLNNLSLTAELQTEDSSAQTENRSVKWWIGLFRDSWSWSDESNSSFRNWFSEPGNKSCARLGDQGQWKSDDYKQTKPFICYDKHFILVKENKTWEEALLHCRQHHRDLAWFTDEHLKKGVQERAKMADSEVVWVGLYYTCFLEAWVSVNGHFVSEGDWADPGPNDCGVAGAMEREGENLWVKKPSEERHNFICAAHC